MEVLPEWIHWMLNAEFQTTHHHKNRKYYQKSHFCVSCRGPDSLSKAEVEMHHAHHKVFRARKASWHYAYTKKNVDSLGARVLDATGVCPYVFNGRLLYFPRTRLPPGGGNNHHRRLRGTPGSCFTCRWKSVKKPFLFCSILCKYACTNADRPRLEAMINMMEEEEEDNATTTTAKKRKGDKHVILDDNDDTGNEKKKKRRRRVEKQPTKDDDDIQTTASFRMIRRKRKGVPFRAPFF